MYYVDIIQYIVICMYYIFIIAPSEILYYLLVTFADLCVAFALFGLHLKQCFEVFGTYGQGVANQPDWDPGLGTARVFPNVCKRPKLQDPRFQERKLLDPADCRNLRSLVLKPLDPKRPFWILDLGSGALNPNVFFLDSPWCTKGVCKLLPLHPQVA